MVVLAYYRGFKFHISVTTIDCDRSVNFCIRAKAFHQILLGNGFIRNFLRKFRQLSSYTYHFLVAVIDEITKTVFSFLNNFFYFAKGEQ